MHLAIREKRCLTREDFRVVFDDVTRESVPKSELAVLRMLSLHVMNALPAMAMATTAWENGFETTFPPLPAPCCPRATLVGDLISALLRNQLLALSGSTGTGKSTLAKLIAARTGHAWLWVNCGGRNTALINFRLHQLAKQLPQATGPVSVVFDNFAFDAQESADMCRSLAATILLVLRTGGSVIVTSQRSLPELFRRELPLLDEAFRTVPALGEDEVEEFCALAGCSDHGQRKLWSRIIWLQAQGHPQLTHARVSVAARRGWPAANPAELLQTPEDIKEELALARQLLRELDDGQRELLYRLSIASRPFRRDHAVAAGEIAPVLPHVGDSFDALVGPWIERRGTEYFRLSPLLTGAGEANWSADRLREMRAAYGRAVMRCGKATLWEASEALFQAILVQDDQLAGPIFVRIMVAPRKYLPLVASELDWLFYFTKDEPLFAENRVVNLMLRQVQFHLAAASEHRQAANLAELLNRESQQPIDPDLDDLMRATSAVAILSAVKVRVRPGTLLRCWLDADRLSHTSTDVKKYAQKIEQGRGKELIPRGFSDTLFSFVLARDTDAAFLNDFVAAADALEPVERAKILMEQVIRWCAQDAGALQSTPIATPRPGACSELRERAQHDALQKYPRGPLLFSWYSLGEAELCGRLGNAAFNKLISRPDASKYPWLESLIAHLKLKRAFANRDFDKLALLVEKTARATATAKANPVEAPALFVPNESPKQVDDYTSEAAAWAPEVFAAALIVLVATGKDVLPTIETWKASAAKAKSKFDYHGLLDQAAQLLTSDPRSAYLAYRTRPSSRFQQMVSALRMGTDPDSSLEACFVGLVTLVTDELLVQGRLDVHESFFVLVAPPSSPAPESCHRQGRFCCRPAAG